METGPVFTWRAGLFDMGAGNRTHRMILEPRRKKGNWFLVGLPKTVAIRIRNQDMAMPGSVMLVTRRPAIMIMIYNLKSVIIYFFSTFINLAAKSYPPRSQLVHVVLAQISCST